MRHWCNSIQHWLYPPTCVLCGDDGFEQLDLCEACKNSLPRLTAGCRICALPIALQSQQQICGECLHHPPAFAATHALLHYQEPVSYLVQQLKFNAKFAHGRLLASLMAAQLAHIQQKPQLLIPVPLHRQRYRQRGFNQSAELTRHLSKLLNIPYQLDLCERTRNTRPQSELNAKQRRRNLRRVFQSTKTCDYHSVAIIDDVMTTGSTVRAVANALQKNGIHDIQVWVCARA